MGPHGFMSSSFFAGDAHQFLPSGERVTLDYDIRPRPVGDPQAEAGAIVRIRPAPPGAVEQMSQGRRTPPTPPSWTAIVTQEDNGFVAQCTELGTVSQGRSAREAVENLREATMLYLGETLRFEERFA